MLALARSVDEEAPRFAADLGLTAYEAGVMLRAPMPVIVFRSEDRARVRDVVGKLRSRGHEVVACELEAVVSSEEMFHPRAFRLEGADLVGLAHGEERRLPLADVFAFVRANHTTRVEATVATTSRQVSISRTVMTGGLLVTKATTSDAQRVSVEREAVLYVFRTGEPPWLLASTQMRYDGLGAQLRRSTMENFEVLVATLRELAPSTSYDTRLLAVRTSPTVIAAGPKHLTASSSGTLDVLAHVVSIALAGIARPYR